MSANKHAMMLKAMIVVAILSGMIFVFFIFTSRHPTNAALNMGCVSFAVFMLVWIMVLYLVPVRCRKVGCNGRMRRTWVKAPNFQVRLRYICAICGDVYDTNIYVGWGEPY